MTATLSTYTVHYTTQSGRTARKDIHNVGSEQSAIAAFWSSELYRDGAEAADQSKPVEVRTETLAEVLADLKVEQADADLQRLRRPGFHHSPFTGGPAPLV